MKNVRKKAMITMPIRIEWPLINLQDLVSGAESIKGRRILL